MLTLLLSLLFSVGRGNEYDTYLSPLSYSGPEVKLEWLSERPFRQVWEMDTRTRIEYALLTNATSSAHEHSAAITFEATPLRMWQVGSFSLGVGPQATMLIGGVYNTRNSTNPAQARATLHADHAAKVGYKLRIKNRHLPLSYSLSTPVVGAAFSPQYGQSYYNIFSQGNYDGNVICTHPGNALSLEQRFTVSLPCARRSLIVGYESSLRQAKPHALRQHHYSRTLLIGLTL